MRPFYFWRCFCRLHRACARCCCAQINGKRTRWTRRAKTTREQQIDITKAELENYWSNGTTDEYHHVVHVPVPVSGKEDDADDDGASIPIHNTNTAKPMLNVRKSEINECWREDESNASGKYLKNRVSQQKRTDSFTIEWMIWWLSWVELSSVQLSWVELSWVELRDNHPNSTRIKIKEHGGAK